VRSYQFKSAATTAALVELFTDHAAEYVRPLKSVFADNEWTSLSPVECIQEACPCIVIEALGCTFNEEPGHGLTTEQRYRINHFWPMEGATETFETSTDRTCSLLSQGNALDEVPQLVEALGERLISCVITASNPNRTLAESHIGWAAVDCTISLIN